MSDNNLHGVRFTDNIDEELHTALSQLEADKVFLLTDANVDRCVNLNLPGGICKYVVPAGESSKSVETACELWRWLAEQGATRRSLLINLGGGVVSDLGGFVASTFKRGIRFLNVPTTLLAMVDAAIGGKTGIDFMGYKNEVGTFAMPEAVIIAPRLLDTLPDAELRSGFAEVVKTAIIADAGVYESLLTPDALYDKEVMARAIRFAARTKQEIVTKDPTERGLRKILNFGHTAGHAYEEYAAMIGRPISHGEAVAHGMLKALELSAERLGFPRAGVAEYKEKILDRYFRPLPFPTTSTDSSSTFTEVTDPAVATIESELNRLMLHDKKNLADGQIRFVLLRALAKPITNVENVECRQCRM